MAIIFKNTLAGKELTIFSDVFKTF